MIAATHGSDGRAAAREPEAASRYMVMTKSLGAQRRICFRPELPCATGLRRNPEIPPNFGEQEIKTVFEVPTATAHFLGRFF